MMKKLCENEAMNLYSFEKFQLLDARRKLPTFAAPAGVVKRCLMPWMDLNNINFQIGEEKQLELVVSVIQFQAVANALLALDRVSRMVG